MHLRFTKMQGAGNDFVVLDATRGRLALSRAQLQRLGNRRFGVGADQILLVERADAPDVDFRYRIFNGASGAEVEHCGNGARCFVRYVREHGLTDKRRVRVRTVNRVLELTEQADGRVTVDMGAPAFEPSALPFDPAGLTPRLENGFALWPLQAAGRDVEVAVLSMGNPHAVLRVDDVAAAPVSTLGPLIESHADFPRRVNAGFMQVLGESRIKLRVFERGAGETLACGTGACAAAVYGMTRGWLRESVTVELPGGKLWVSWGGEGHSVVMSGPTAVVFEGSMRI